MNEIKGLGRFSNDQEKDKREYRPMYSVNEENLKELLDYYFPGLETGNIKQICRSIRDRKYSLNELEYLCSKMLRHLQSMWDLLEKEPTQVNMLDYLIECFIDENWDGLEKDIDRLMVVKELKNKVEKIYQYSHQKEFNLANDIKFHFISPLYLHSNALIDFDNVEKLENSEWDDGENNMENENDWINSKYYDDV